MKIKKIVIGGVLLVIGLPEALIAVAVAWFRMEGKTNGAIVTSGQTRRTSAISSNLGRNCTLEDGVVIRMRRQ
jgi:hypothetical protein